MYERIYSLIVLFNTFGPYTYIHNYDDIMYLNIQG